MEITGNQKAEVSGQKCSCRSEGFTLIELLVVITIIVILMGLLFPAFRGVQDQAKKTQAKNDLAQIVTAVNAFYTEYGKYPTTATTDATATYGSSNTNDAIFNELRGLAGAALNTRQIAFISPADVKDGANPRGGIGTTTKTGQFFDPWAKPYNIEIDADYDNQIVNPYSANTGAGSGNIRQGVIAWSLGTDGRGGSGTKNTGDPADDVISWQ